MDEKIKHGVKLGDSYEDIAAKIDKLNITGEVIRKRSLVSEI